MKRCKSCSFLIDQIEPIPANSNPTTTFQAGLSPPGGIWQDSTGSNKIGTGSGSNERAHSAGKTIMGSNHTLFLYFVASNTIGFFVSLYMIKVLTSNFPLPLELQICIVAMYSTYNTAVFSIAPENVRFFVLLFSVVLPTLVTLAVQNDRLSTYITMAIFNHNDLYCSIKRDAWRRDVGATVQPKLCR